MAHVIDYNVHRPAWVRPRLRRIVAGSAEFDAQVGGDAGIQNS